MLTVKRFTVNPIQENTFLIWDETKAAAIIDCGTLYDDEKRRLSDFIRAEGLTLEHALQTHTHFDHVFGLPYLYETYGLRPEIHERDLPVYDNFHTMLTGMGLPDLDVTMPPVGRYLRHADTIQLGNEVLQVIHTPGHTPGGVCFYAPESKMLFSGDTLFYGSVGRTDFPGGSMLDLLTAIKTHLLALPDDVTVFTGHGGRTTIGHERLNNFYIR